MSVLATAEPWDLVAAAYTTEALPYFELFSREALRLAALPAQARRPIGKEHQPEHRERPVVRRGLER